MILSTPLPLVGRGWGWGRSSDRRCFNLATPSLTLPHKATGFTDFAHE